MANNNYVSSNADTKNFPIPILFSFPVIIYTIGYPIFRPLGMQALIFVCVCALIACFASRTIILWHKFIPFALFSVVILAFSLADWMPKSWTVYYERFAAIRQWIWIPILPIITTAFYIVLTYFTQVLLRRALLIFAIVLITSRISRFYSSLEISDQAIYFLYTLTNDTVAVFLLFVVWLYSKKRSNMIDFIAISMMLAYSSSTQTQLLMLVLTAVRFTPFHKSVVVALFFATYTFLSIAPFYPIELHTLDSNIGIRALFWRDTLIAIKESSGLGVGYGTEYITNNFTELKNRGWFIISETDAGRLYIGTHSAVYNVLLRTGVIGLVLFLMWYIPVLLPPRRIPTQNAKLFSSVIAILIINGSINMGFTSINFLFGTSLSLAVLHILRTKSKVWNLN